MNLIRKLRPIVPRDGEKEKGFASEKVSKMPLFQGAYEKPPALLGFIIPFHAEMSTLLRLFSAKSRENSS
jgi:hypothetical protein